MKEIAGWTLERLFPTQDKHDCLFLDVHNHIKSMLIIFRINLQIRSHKDRETMLTKSVMQKLKRNVIWIKKEDYEIH